MQFKQPEILFALLLIIIPIIVHLFHLQRFVKVPFTNVKFLKKIEQQTRKSSQLKKWIILTLRSLAFTCIILAFSQPYFSNQQKNIDTQTIIYLDNSLSMTYQKDGQQILIKSAQELIENLEYNSKVTLLTNDNLFIDLDRINLKNTLLNLKLSPNSVNLESIFLKLTSLIPSSKNTLNKIVLISDFQTINNLKKGSVTNVNAEISLTNVAPEQFKNIFLDSVYISKQTSDQIYIKTAISNTNTADSNVSISLFNNDILIGKTTTPIDKNKVSEVEFSIPTQENFQGKLILEDNNLQFDNTLFFNLDKPSKTNVLSIGKKTDFLPKIYTRESFNFSHKTIHKINYNDFENQHVIILNEVDKISNALKSSLIEFQKNDGCVVIIPSSNSELLSYNAFFNQLNIGNITSLNNQETIISTINYEHPIFNGVFEKKVTNFEYPSIKSYYKTQFRNISPIIQYQNKDIFVGQSNIKNGSVFWFSAPLSKDNGNFQNSPLIVPTLYNIAINSHKHSELSYTISTNNKIIIDAQLNTDHILKLTSSDEELIPIQQVFKNKVEISTFSEPNLPGHYDINYQDQILKKVSYNYSRDQSVLNYTDLHNLFDDQDHITVSNSISQTMNKLSSDQKINLLFRWFLALAVLFLLLEIATLKFYKT